MSSRFHQVVLDCSNPFLINRLSHPNRRGRDFLHAPPISFDDRHEIDHANADRLVRRQP